MLVLEFNLDKTVFHAAVHLSNVNGWIWVADVSGHLVWGHTLSHDASGLFLFLNLLRHSVVFFLLLLDGLLVGLDSVVELIGVMLVPKLNINVLVE